MEVLLSRWKSPNETLERLPDGSWSLQEGDELRIQVRATSPTEATLAGEPLAIESISQQDALLETRFRLGIHTWAGRSRLQLRAGTIEQHLMLDVRPHPGKLGLDAYHEMLAELTVISKDLPWGLGAGSHAASRNEGSPAVVHASVIDAELPELLRAVRRLADDPLIWTERERILDRLPANRRVDSGSFRWLVAHPQSLAALKPGGNVRSAFIEQRRIRSTMNHPATRYVRFLLERLMRVLRTSGEAFQRISRQEPRAGEYACVLRNAILELEGALRRAPFKGVPAEPPGPASLQAVIDHPGYSRVQRLAQRLLDPGLRLDEQGLLQSGLGHTYELFELLVLYRLARGMGRALGLNWDFASAPSSAFRLLDRPPDGSLWRAAAPGGLTVELRYQQVFQAWNGKAAEFQSLSGQRRPDYILLLSRHAQPLAWLVLDAKYRSSREAIHEGLAELHVYRDSLRWKGLPARAAFILIPRAADNAASYVSSDYHRVHQFGALALDGADWLQPVVTELLNAAGLDAGAWDAALQAQVPHSTAA